MNKKEMKLVERMGSQWLKQSNAFLEVQNSALRVCFVGMAFPDKGELRVCATSIKLDNEKATQELMEHLHAAANIVAMDYEYGKHHKEESSKCAKKINTISEK
jgi:hypothetical protein